MEVVSENKKTSQGTKHCINTHKLTCCLQVLEQHKFCSQITEPFQNSLTHSCILTHSVPRLLGSLVCATTKGIRCKLLLFSRRGLQAATRWSSVRGGSGPLPLGIVPLLLQVRPRHPPPPCPSHRLVERPWVRAVVQTYPLTVTPLTVTRY